MESVKAIRVVCFIFVICHYLFVGMSESNAELPSEGDYFDANDPVTFSSQKRPRGPNDCLNWDDSDEEEEVTPFTQIPESPTREMVDSVASSAKGKSLGMFFCNVMTGF
jgi:hypothetical protein